MKKLVSSMLKVLNLRMGNIVLIAVVRKFILTKTVSYINVLNNVENSLLLKSGLYLEILKYRLKNGY